MAGGGMRRGAAGAGTRTLRAGGRRRTGRPGPGAVAGRWRPSWPARAQASASGRLGLSHRDRAGGVTAGGRGTGQRSVARRLYICPHTVNTPRRHVLATLGVPNRVALAAEVHHSIERCLRRWGGRLPARRLGVGVLAGWWSGRGCASGCLPSGRPSSRAGHRVHRAWVGDRRAARIAGSRPARAPMSRAAARPPAQASGGMMVAQPLCRA